MQDHTRVTPVPSTLLHNATEMRSAYTRAAARHAGKAAARQLRVIQQWVSVRLWPNRPAAG